MSLADSLAVVFEHFERARRLRRPKPHVPRVDRHPGQREIQSQEYADRLGAEVGDLLPLPRNRKPKAGQEAAPKRVPVGQAHLPLASQVELERSFGAESDPDATRPAPDDEDAPATPDALRAFMQRIRRVEDALDRRYDPSGRTTQFVTDPKRGRSLNPDREADLGRRITAGREAAAALAAGVPEARRPALEAAVRDGLVAQNDLMEANLRLVVWQARRIAAGLKRLEPRDPARGIDVMDLIQDGIGHPGSVDGTPSTGLLAAVERFDPQRGRFSTLGTYWVAGAVRRALNRYRRDAHDSLDRPASDDDDASETTIADLVPDPDAGAAVERGANLEDLRQHLRDALGSLPKHLADVVRLRIGLGDGRPRSFDDIAKAIRGPDGKAVSRETVRAWEREAFKRLRKSRAVYAMRDWFDVNWDWGQGERPTVTPTNVPPPPKTPPVPATKPAKAATVADVFDTLAAGGTVTPEQVELVREAMRSNKAAVREGLTSVLMSDDPARAVRAMVDSGVAELVLPEVPALRAMGDEHGKHKDVYEHTLQVLANAVRLEKTKLGGPDVTIRLAALLHDVGKPSTRAEAVRRRSADGRTVQLGRVRQSPDGKWSVAEGQTRRWTGTFATRRDAIASLTGGDSKGVKVDMSFHDHDLEGAALVTRRLRELGFPARVVTDVADLTRLHLRSFGFGEGERAGPTDEGGRAQWTDSAVRRYATDAGRDTSRPRPAKPDLLDRLQVLARADSTGIRAPRVARDLDRLDERITQVHAKDEADRPILTGKQIGRVLGVDPDDPANRPTIAAARTFLADESERRGHKLTDSEARKALQGWTPPKVADIATAPSVADVLRASPGQKAPAARVALDRTFPWGSVHVEHADPDGPDVLLQIGVYGLLGEHLGVAFRRLGRDGDGNLYAHHESFALEDGMRGKGIGTEFNDHLERWYRASGVRYVTAYAADSVGGYYHAVRGYQWNGGGVTWDVLAELRKRKDMPEVAAILARIDAGEDPSPFEVSQLGRRPGDTTWVGKQVMLASSWPAIKYLPEPAPIAGEADTAGVMAPWRGDYSPDTVTIDDLTPGTPLRDRYEPGRWQRLTAEGLATANGIDADTADDLIHYDDDGEYIQAAQEYRNGSHVLRVETDAPVDVSTLMAAVEHWIGLVDPGEPVHVTVRPQAKVVSSRTGRLASGNTLLGAPVITLSDRALLEERGLEPGRYMPVRQDVPWWAYVLGHEWGHAMDRDGSARPDGVLAASEYSDEGGDAELFAEAFVEWYLSMGQTSDRTARAYAEHYGWDILPARSAPTVFTRARRPDRPLLVAVDTDDGPELHHADELPASLLRWLARAGVKVQPSNLESEQ